MRALVWLTALFVPVLCLPTATGPNMTWVEEEECDRSMSRHVRTFIQHSIYPQLSVKPEELPKACPLHPDNYLYADQEAQKHEESRMDWKCNICGKHLSQNSIWTSICTTLIPTISARALGTT